MNKTSHIIFCFLSLVLISCKGSTEDPFVSPKIGTVTESHAASLSANSSARSFVLLRVGRVTDLVVIDKNVAKIKEGPAPKWQSMTVKTGHAPPVKKLYSDLIADGACVSKVPDIKELLDLYPSLTPICDKNVILMLDSATSLSLSTAEKGDQDFSSWGINLHDAGGGQILIYSLYL